MRDRVIFDNRQTGGFDIAAYDVPANLANLWSLCYGRRAVHDGPAVWTVYRQTHPELAAEADRVAAAGVNGRDLKLEKTAPTILGEIQTGNWGLAYRDLMKLLAADAEIDVDLFIYIAADGTLADAISSGTVNFASFVEELEQFRDLVRVPTWVIGVDLAGDLTI